MQNPAELHIPVLLPEVMEALAPRPGGRYVDGTLGLGGHTEALLERAEGKAQICCLDRDEEALQLAKKRLEPYGSACSFFHMPFKEAPQALNSLGWDKIDGALLDLGVSSLQIDSPERGFSFLHNGPLDMRMDHGHVPQDAIDGAITESAAHFIAHADFNTLRRVIEEYGEDPQAGRIARAILDSREKNPIETTGQLADIVFRAYPPKWRATARNHPATRTFQALRMVVNNELGQLSAFLDGIFPHLAAGARLAVISFHSLEDRMVKQRFRKWATACVCPPYQARCTCGHSPEVKILTPKPVQASQEEIRANPRSSSAKLRVAEKLPTPLLSAILPTQGVGL